MGVRGHGGVGAVQGVRAGRGGGDRAVLGAGGGLPVRGDAGAWQGDALGRARSAGARRPAGVGGAGGVPRRARVAGRRVRRAHAGGLDLMDERGEVKGPANALQPALGAVQPQSQTPHALGRLMR